MKKSAKKKQKLPPMARKAEKAMRMAVAEVIKDHHRRGEPIVVWRKGKVVKVSV